MAKSSSGKTLADALAAGTVDLGTFEGADVLSVGIEIPSAAGGLRDSVKIDPFVMHRGEEHLILLRCTVGKIRFDPVKDTKGVMRVHVLDTMEAAIVEGDVYDAALAAEREKIEKARQDAIGKGPLEEQILLASHEDGEHDQFAEGCPACIEASEAAEAAAAAAGD